MRGSKAEVVSGFKSSALKFDMMELSGLQVKMYGDTAIVTYVTTDKGAFKDPASGKEMKIDGKTQWTDTFVNVKGKWQIVATQGTFKMIM
jgi:hypothetical protein